MNGIIVLNAYVKNSSQVSQAKRLCEELSAFCDKISIVKNVDLAYIDGANIAGPDADFCVFLDKDKSCAALIEKSGVRVFNKAKSIALCDNKMYTHIALAGYGIPMPKTVYAPLCYNLGEMASDEFLQKTYEKLGFPLIGKMCYGSLGDGIFLLHDPDEMRSFENGHILDEHMYQEFINCGEGKDTRVIVIGGKTVCAYERVNEKDFRSNIEKGGHGEETTISPETAALCEKTASLLDLDYCGIDVLKDIEGREVVCEVNSNAFFKTAEAVTKVNIARRYAEHIISEMKINF